MMKNMSHGSMLLLWCGAVQAATPLPQLGAVYDMLTVSGLSSGAYMAVQFQIAHSSMVSGAGIIAGGPYDCAQSQFRRALVNCMAPRREAYPPGLNEQHKAIGRVLANGKIDSPHHLRAQRVWLFSGGNDRTVYRSVMDSLAEFYQSYMTESAVRYIKHPDAGHAFISVDAKNPNVCTSSDPPFINQCQQLDMAGEMLAHLLGTLKEKGSRSEGSMLRFDQRPFVPGKWVDASLAEEGFVYVPKACETGGCRIHVTFHGCQQNIDAVGTRFVEGAGYNGWADSNRLVVLYPQTRSRHGPAIGSWKFILNPKGCWDWWGYTGANHHTRQGVQIRAVKAMIDHLVQPNVR